MNATVETFLETHKLNYKVSKQPAIQRIVTDGVESFEEVEGQYHLVRSTDNAVISPSTVTDRYAPMNPQQLVAPLEPLVAEGWISPDKGFLFKGGSYEVIAFRIDGGQLEDGGSIAGEDWSHFLSIHNHQGGGGKVKGSIHSHRIVCQNTAVAAARMASFGIRHTGEVQENYDWAISTFKRLKDEIRKLSDRMTVLADLAVTPTQAEEILMDIYGVKGKNADQISTRTANELEFAMMQFANPRLGTFGKSAADVYNAITATNTHYKPKGSKEDDNKRLSSLFDSQGSRYKLEEVAVTKLLTLAGIED